MKLPWDVPPERRLPVPFRERLRILLKVFPVVAGFFWFRARIQNEPNAVGPAVLFVTGIVVAWLAVIELLWLRNATDAERIFTKTKTQAFILQACAFAAGVTLLVVGLTRGAL